MYVDGTATSAILLVTPLFDTYDPLSTNNQAGVQVQYPHLTNYTTNPHFVNQKAHTMPSSCGWLLSNARIPSWCG